MRRAAIVAGLAIAACSSPAANEGGVGLPPPGGSCPRGLAVASSDYASSTISVCGADGKVLRAAMLTSGSRAPGVSQALSGDVVLPSTRPRSGRMVLIDRYPNSVITFVDTSSGAVTRQIDVSTGFPSNPHDYLETREGRALVTRYERNPKAGRAPFDAGGDVLAIDTTTGAIAARIELATPADGAFQPRPDRMLEVDGVAWVLLQRLDGSFQSAGDGRIVGIDEATEAVAFTVDLPGAANCGAAARSPSGKLVAVACSGLLRDRAVEGQRSAVVLLDASTRPPKVIRTVPAPAGVPLLAQIGFASESTLLGGTYGSLDAGRTDTIVAIDASTGAITRLADAGQAFVVGDVRCAPGCGPCFVTDARANAIRVFSPDPDGRIVEGVAQPVDRVTGLPPRYAGFL